MADVIIPGNDGKPAKQKKIRGENHKVYALELQGHGHTRDVARPSVVAPGRSPTIGVCSRLGNVEGRARS